MSKAPRKPPGPLSIELSAAIRAEIARRHDLKQGTVAASADISSTQLSQILADKKQFDIEQLDRVCFALGLPLGDLVRAAEAATPSRHAERDAKARKV